MVLGVVGLIEVRDQHLRGDQSIDHVVQLGVDFLLWLLQEFQLINHGSQTLPQMAREFLHGLFQFYCSHFVWKGFLQEDLVHDHWQSAFQVPKASFYLLSFSSRCSYHLLLGFWGDGQTCIYSQVRLYGAFWVQIAA